MIAKKIVMLCCMLMMFIPYSSYADEDDKIVVFHTPQGKLIIEFFWDDAELHVDNFITLAESGFYDNTAFHRIVKGLFIQGGDPNTKNEEKNTWGTRGSDDAIKAEFNTKKHDRGIVSMARSVDPNSASSQFFIVHEDSHFLDGDYTIFGKIITQESFDTLDNIASVPTESRDIPITPEQVKITKTEVLKHSELLNLHKLNISDKTTPVGSTVMIDETIYPSITYINTGETIIWKKTNDTGPILFDNSFMKKNIGPDNFLKLQSGTMSHNFTIEGLFPFRTSYTDSSGGHQRGMIIVGEEGIQQLKEIQEKTKDEAHISITKKCSDDFFHFSPSLIHLKKGGTVSWSNSEIELTSYVVEIPSVLIELGVETANIPDNDLLLKPGESKSIEFSSDLGHYANGYRVFGHIENSDFEGSLVLWSNDDFDLLSSDEDFSPYQDKSATIPSWIKSNAGWWSNGDIDDNEFVSGIQYLINNHIIQISKDFQKPTNSQKIPSWIKSNAGWWSQGLIPDNEFVSGIQYLVESGVITIDHVDKNEESELRVNESLTLQSSVSENPNFNLRSDNIGLPSLFAGETTKPHSINIDKFGKVFVSEYDCEKIKVFDHSGNLVEEISPFDVLEITESSQGTTSKIVSYKVDDVRNTDMVIDTDNNLYITKNIYPDISKYNANHHLELEFGSFCSSSGTDCIDPDGEGPLIYGAGQFVVISGIDTDTKNNVYAYDPPLGKINKFDQNGKILDSFILPNFVEPGFYNLGEYFGINFDVSVNDLDQLYVLDGASKEIHKFESDGAHMMSFALSNEFVKADMPVAIDVFELTGDLFIVDKGHNNVLVFDSAGHYKFSFGSSGKDIDSLRSPSDIKIDNFRNHLLIADTNNDRVVVYPIIP